uniref:Reverse transcriptase domain-containing protein n=1 Tax=Nicotiana tabacum TaxID=4097 RepID=A0A1S3YUA9_TOBAC|nr:PREDICTED: uncharacterized protein LOC107779743 [Nicotiana tabacum]
MDRAINCTSLTLIPKYDHPVIVKESRPIACCIVLYKIISKVLASRLQKVIASIVCEARAGFIPGRKISDNIFLAQELVLDELVFPRQFTMWTLECVKTVNYSILVNGEPTTPFDAAKWLRQGDLISPFLFALAMEYLSIKLNELKGNKVFKYHPKCSKLAVTHISFADDLLLFSRGDVESDFKLTKRRAPFILEESLRSFKIKSYNWRSQLIQTVLFGIQAYWSQLFAIPSKVPNTIEAYCRSYLWSGTNTITRKALIDWDKVCTPKSMGGPGLLNIRLWNKAAIAKASWDIEHKIDRFVDLVVICLLHQEPAIQSNAYPSTCRMDGEKNI